MSFADIIEEFEGFYFEDYFASVKQEDVLKSIERAFCSRPGYHDLLNLLSPAATDMVEDLAKASRRLTLQYFGRSIGMFMPLYISNFCTNRCLYCGFNSGNTIVRKHLTLEEIEREAAEIAKTGIRHILLLTGEAPGMADYKYIESAVILLKKYFNSISIEIYPMSEADYSSLKKSGVDGLTIYQETYDRALYKKYHLSGPKTDYDFRLDAPERGAKAGFNFITIGALYGLAEPRREAFFSAMHERYLIDKYTGTEFALSIPRITSAPGVVLEKNIITDRMFVQFMCAFRLFNQRSGITVSTRERADFRDNLLGLGVTRFSAGSRTDVGGYSCDEKSSVQFEINDNRSYGEVISAINEKGFYPVHKDWDILEMSGESGSI